MKHYIVTNRQIIYDNGIERITENGYVPASTVLRFATYDTETKKMEVIPDIKLENDGTVDYQNCNGGSGFFFKQLYEKMSKSQNSKDLLVFVHGFGNGENDVETHIRKLHKHYVDQTGRSRTKNVDTILLFYWTTNGKRASITEYKNDSDDAKIAGVALSRLYVKVLCFFKHLFREMDEQPCKKNIHLMCHSMGSQVLQYMIETLTNESINRSYPLLELFKEIVLVASDVSENILEKGQAFSHLNKLAERVHIYIHRRDIALGLSNHINGVDRLGNANINELPIIKNVYYINAKNVTKGGWQGIKDEAVQHWYHTNHDRFDHYYRHYHLHQDHREVLE